MNVDAMLRAAAVVIAAGLLAAPYWPAVARRVAEVAKAADIGRADIARFAAACLLIYAAFGTGLVPAIRSFEWSVTNVVMVMKVCVGLALIGSAFVEAARWSQSRMRPTP